MIQKYRIATEEEKKGRCAEEYDLLLGPNGFECCLTEPEDRTWWRDGGDVIAKLNEQHEQIQLLNGNLKEKKEKRMRPLQFGDLELGDMFNTKPNRWVKISATEAIAVYFNVGTTREFDPNDDHIVVLYSRLKEWWLND